MSNKKIMNKKGEFVILGIIAITLALISLYYVETVFLEEKEINYIGDKSTKIAYNLKSSNPNCDLDNIFITKENIVFFDSRQSVESKGFRVYDNCN